MTINEEKKNKARKDQQHIQMILMMHVHMFLCLVEAFRLVHKVEALFRRSLGVMMFMEISTTSNLLDPEAKPENLGKSSSSGEQKITLSMLKENSAKRKRHQNKRSLETVVLTCSLRQHLAVVKHNK